MTKRLLCLVFLCSFIFSSYAYQQADQHDAEKRQLTFGIVPQQSASTLAAKWGPVLRRLSEETNIQIRFVTAKNIPTFEARLAKGEYDIAYMNPYHYVSFEQAPGYQAFAKEPNKMLKGVIVVPKSSAIRKLSDLHSLRMAFPAPAAFAASIIPQTILQNKGIEVSPKYVFSHDSVYLNVARGFLPAGGGVMRTFNAAPEEVREKLKIIWKSPGFTPHALAAHPRVDEEDKTAILLAFARLKEDEAFITALDKLKISTFEAAKGTDWDDIRELGISGFLVQSAPN